MIIETCCLSKTYGLIQAVAGLNLRVPEGGISALLGPNGHGKSTTIKMLLGIAHPTAGEGWVLGLPIDVPKASLEIRRRTGFASEDKQSYGFMTVQQALDLTRSLYPSWRADRQRELLRELELPVDRKIRQLSKGMRTKLALILALSRGVELLIFDEPSEGLDSVVAEVMLQAHEGHGARVHQAPTQEANRGPGKAEAGTAERKAATTLNSAVRSACVAVRNRCAAHRAGAQKSQMPHAFCPSARSPKWRTNVDMRHSLPSA